VDKSLIAGAIASVMAIGLVVTLGVLSLLSGGLHFLFARPRLEVLRPKNRETGFAFGFKWDSAREPAKFNRVKVELFNPFGKPTQIILSREFVPQDSTFAVDVDFGEPMREFWEAKGMRDARVVVEVAATKEGVSHQFEMKGEQFKLKYHGAKQTLEEFNEKHTAQPSKPLYHIPERSFIAEPLPESDKILKIASNPAFAGNFSNAQAAGGSKEKAEDNFSISKVWIEPGCIVCDACEDIYPEVFDVQDETCVIRPDAPLDNGLLVQEAAEACPVEVIQFKKA
jgi:ferredoxin